MPIDLSKMQAAVARDATVNQSAITLLTNLSQLLREAAEDPAAVNALADALDAQQSALAAAVSANTPTPPTPPAPPAA